MRDAGDAGLRIGAAAIEAAKTGRAQSLVSKQLFRLEQDAIEAHEAAHPAEQGGVVHGLGQEVVGPGVEAAQAVFRHAGQKVSFRQ